jgi:hypothetical protein
MSASDAVMRSVPLLQRADVTFLQKARCVSCHNNSLTAMTVAAARAKRLPVNEQIAKDQMRLIAGFLLENSAGGMENIGIPGAGDTVSYILAGMAADLSATLIPPISGRATSESSERRWFLAHHLKRPPLESSDIEVTAVSLRALRAFGLLARSPVYEIHRRGSEMAGIPGPRTPKTTPTDQDSSGAAAAGRCTENGSGTLTQQRPDGVGATLRARLRCHATGRHSSDRTSNVIAPSDPNFIPRHPLSPEFPE